MAEPAASTGCERAPAVSSRPQMGTPPLTLYVHLPWCVHKCPYCDFNSHALRGALPEDRYVAALIADLDHDLVSIRDRTIESVFFGGGTPSLFSAHAIARVLEHLQARAVCAPDMEITLEANPGTVERERFPEYRAAGVNRLSIGVQSFDDERLARLGRIHDGGQARAAVRAARAAGFDNVNLDLMYGLPGQSPRAALEDVRLACALEPAHLSHYQLTLEPGTVFHARPPADLPDEDACWRMQVMCQARLAAHGYTQYEVSAYARSGFQCRHNLNYWRFGDYLGIGAGAHAKLSNPQTGVIHRCWKLRSPRGYLSRSGSARIAGAHFPGAPEVAFEFMLNALRLAEGFTSRDFERRTGCGFDRIALRAATARRDGLLEHGADGTWRASPLGWRFLNDLQVRFLPA